jgi:hypothetical protein
VRFYHKKRLFIVILHQGPYARDISLKTDPKRTKGFGGNGGRISKIKVVNTENKS